MKPNLIYSVLAMALLSSVSACKDDDETPIAGISFEIEEQEENESNGTPESFHPDYTAFDGVGRVIPVKIVLDRASAQQIVLKYDVSGSAELVNPADANGRIVVNDFSLSAGAGIVALTDDELTIEKGVSEAIVNIVLYEDGVFEFDAEAQILTETIELELESIVSGPGKLAADKLSYELTVMEDDPVVYLAWFVDESDVLEDVRTVDMDLFIRQNGLLVGRSDQDNTQLEPGDYPYEITFFPAGLPSGSIGLSYTYYSGTSDKVDFGVMMWGTINGQFYSYVADDPTLIGEQTYTTANINNDYEANDPIIVQTMVKDGINIKDISAITKPDAGSRTRPFQLELTPAILKQLSQKRFDPLTREFRVRK